MLFCFVQISIYITLFYVHFCRILLFLVSNFHIFVDYCSIMRCYVFIKMQKMLFKYINAYVNAFYDSLIHICIFIYFIDSLDKVTP